jgi:hypothetical protein
MTGNYIQCRPDVIRVVKIRFFLNLKLAQAFKPDFNNRLIVDYELFCSALAGYFTVNFTTRPNGATVKAENAAPGREAASGRPQRLDFTSLQV